MSNNLGPALTSTYHLVTDPFPVYTSIGTAESTTYIGRFMALGTVYRELTAASRDQIHNLPGGVFLVTGQARVGIPIRIALPEGHIFEHGNAHPERWPLPKLSPLHEPRSVTHASPARTSLLSYRQLQHMNAVRIGRTIDWLAP
ncbi:hypothetical protein [Nocardia miyunensis]|uniref:hypothetical protein n=1 Tax=Nocardia miyunensis TaxID=282684 RepID=UPI00082C71CC|nr:hypothetical protein [Nocardia miyunensis]